MHPLNLQTTIESFSDPIMGTSGTEGTIVLNWVFAQHRVTQPVPVQIGSNF